MKKRLFLIAALALLLCGCGDEKTNETSSVPSSVTSVAEVVTKPIMKKVVEVNGADTGLNIRKEPKTDAQILGLAQNGTKFILLSEGEGEWHTVEYDGETAYISASFSKVSEVTEAEALTLTKEKTTSSSSSDSTSQNSTDENSSKSESSTKENATSENSIVEQVGAYRSRKPKTNDFDDERIPADGDMEQ